MDLFENASGNFMKSVAVKFLLLLLCVAPVSSVVGQEKGNKEGSKDADESLVKEVEPGLLM
jgi:hypothetical protein